MSPLQEWYERVLAERARLEMVIKKHSNKEASHG